MQFGDSYQCIDLKKTGIQLENLIRWRGYTVKDIQNALHLSCPQPVYRWMQGKALPSVDNLFILACMLQVHMEELLVMAYKVPDSDTEASHARRRRISGYGQRYLGWEAA